MPPWKQRFCEFRARCRGENGACLPNGFCERPSCKPGHFKAAVRIGNSDGDETECDACPAGSYSPGGILEVCIPCSPGAGRRADLAWQRFRMVSAAHATGCAGFFTASTAGHSSCLLCSAYGGANMYQELPGQTFCKSCEINTELVSDSANVTVTTCRCKRGKRRQPRPRPHIHFIPKCRVEPPAIVASFLGDQLRDAGYYDSSMAASMDAVTSRVCARQSGCASPVSCAFPSCASVRYLVMCVLPAWRDSAAVPLRAWRAVHVVMPMW